MKVRTPYRVSGLLCKGETIYDSQVIENELIDVRIIAPRGYTGETVTADGISYLPYHHRVILLDVISAIGRPGDDYMNNVKREKLMRGEESYTFSVILLGTGYGEMKDLDKGYWDSIYAPSISQVTDKGTYMRSDTSQLVLRSRGDNATNVKSSPLIMFPVEGEEICRSEHKRLGITSRISSLDDPLMSDDGKLISLGCTDGNMVDLLQNKGFHFGGSPGLLCPKIANIVKKYGKGKGIYHDDYVFTSYGSRHIIGVSFKEGDKVRHLPLYNDRGELTPMAREIVKECGGKSLTLPQIAPRIYKRARS